MGCLTSAYPSIHKNSEDHGRLPDKHVSKHSQQRLAHVLDSLVHIGNTRVVGSSTRADACAFTGGPQPRWFELTLLWHSEHCAEITLFQHSFWGHRKKKQDLSPSGCLGLVVRTRKHGCGPGHTGQRTRETTKRRCDMMQGHFFFWSIASSGRHQAQGDAVLQVGDARAGGMSIRSGMGASSSSSSMAQSTGLRERTPARCAWRRARHGNGVTRRLVAGGSTVRRELLLHRALAGVDARRVPEKDPSGNTALPSAPRASRASRVRDDGVPTLHVEPICARLRQLRVVLQELEQDDDEVVTPRPETQHCGHEQKQKRNFGQKDRLTKRKKEGTLYYRNISGEGFTLYYSFTLIPKDRRRVNLQALQFYFNSKTIGL